MTVYKTSEAERAYQKKWRKANAEKIKQQQRKRYSKTRDKHLSYMREKLETVEGRAYQLWSNAAVRARKDKREFTITQEWVVDRLSKGACEVTGIPFTMTAGKGRKPFSPSLDRIDSNLGYTPDNCQAVVTIYNLAKSNFAHAAVLRLAEALCTRASS